MKGAPLRIRALQAVMLRLAVDPAFGARLYGGEPGARVVDLAGGPYTLSDADLAHLRDVDPRAWTTDRYRRTRLVQALIEEYAVTTAIVGVPGVDAFFSSDAFARVLGYRQSMAEAYGLWMVATRTGATRAVAHLEATVCRARRSHRPEGAGYVTTSGVEGVSLPEGTLEAWQEGLGVLGGSPVEAAARGLRWSPPTLGSNTTHLVIERNDGGGLGVHVLSAGVVGLLVLCRSPRTRAVIARQAKRLGLSKKAVGGTLRRMVSDGLLSHRPA